MKSMLATAALAAIFPTLACADPPAREAPWQRLGLMRVRDMTPFGLTRLDFLPAHAVSTTPGTWAVELNLSYQNTWARSDNVEAWLRARGTRRTPLTPDDTAAILALPGDAYLVDGEYGLLDLTLHHRISPHLGVYATIPYFFFGTGLLDDPVEKFHRQFGFGNAGREFVPYNRWNTIIKLGDTRVVLDRAPGNDFGDPVFGLRYSWQEQPRRWNLVLETAVKLPRQSEQSFVSSGAADFGLQLSYQRFLARNALYLTASAVYYDSPEPGLLKERWIPTLVAGWERHLTKRVGFVMQVYASRSTVQNTPLRELTADKLQLTAGVQWLHRGNVLRFGLTENLGSFNNTPDVGLTLSVGRIFTGPAD